MIAAEDTLAEFLADVAVSPMAEKYLPGAASASEVGIPHLPVGIGTGMKMGYGDLSPARHIAMHSYCL